MSRTATHHTTVNWTGEHWGHIVMGNGPEMDFSALPDAQGHASVFTPEDVFVAAANTCIMMMFLWAAERFKLNLISYECRTEGTKLIELDRTEIFTYLRFWPKIVIAAGAEDRSAGLLYTPGLVINNQLVCGGRIPSEAEVMTWVADALN